MAEIYKVDASFDHGFFKGTSCAFGVFDGVHRGHRYLLDCARSTAAETGGASVALTFDIDPDEVFHPTRLKKLMTNEERVRMLADSGVDVVAVLPFTRDFAASSPEEFLVQTFDGTVPSFLHVGYDFKFGARAAGTVRDLDSWAAVGGTSVQAHDLKSDDGAPITATRIRLLLAGGDVEEANRLLGRPYFMTGVVEPGRGEGADMGFRTANLVVPQPFTAAHLAPRGRRALQSRCERGRGRHVRRPRHRHLRGASAGLLGRSLRQARQGGISLLAAPYEKVRRSGRVDSHREGQHSLGAREPVALYFTAQAESLLKRLSYWTVAYACSASSTPAASSLPNPCQMPSAVRNPFRLMAGTASRMASRKR